MTIGAYPGISLAKARELHGAAMMKVQQGVDPGAEAQAAKNRRKAAPTFQDLLFEFWDEELKWKKSGLATKRLLIKDTIPAWGKHKVVDIKRRDIVLLLDRIRDRAPIVRNRVHGALSRIFNFAAERGIIDDSPCIRIKKVPEKGRKRVLSDEEIKLLWAALGLENKAIDLYRVSKLALKMILLTGQRPGEICGMSWVEITDDGFWDIPASRRKSGDSHRVPLGGMALEIIEQARIYSGGSEWVFRSSHKPDQHITPHALSRAIARHWAEIGFKEKFTPHDLRRTLRTRLAELNVPDIVAERVLGHKLQGMMAVYNQYTYLLEKRNAIDLWEQKLRGILGNDEPAKNVINFEVRHAHQR